MGLRNGRGNPPFTVENDGIRASDLAGIFGVRLADGYVRILWWIDRITRERRQVTRFTSYGPYVRYPAWRPGSEEIVFEYSQVKGNVYMLDLP